jgi:hypothetical protein
MFTRAVGIDYGSSGNPFAGFDSKQQNSTSRGWPTTNLLVSSENPTLSNGT